MRTAGSAFLVLCALVLGAAALPSAWLASNVVAEDGFVDLASPLADDAAFTGELAGALSQDAAGSTDQPSGMDAVSPVVGDVAERITGLPEFNQAWDDTLRRSHALTFAGQESPTDGTDAGAAFTLDVAPLIALVLTEIGGQFGIDIPPPEHTVVNIGTAEQRPMVERGVAAAELWPFLAVSAAVAAVIAIALARRRSTTLVVLGLGVLVTAGLLWLGAGFTPELVSRMPDTTAVAGVFTVALADRAAADFQTWCLAALAAGLLLTVAGIVARLAGPRT